MLLTDEACRPLTLNNEINYQIKIMPKVNCCVPLCTTESRANKDLKFYRLPTEKNPRDRQLWIKLIRNENLKLDSQWTSVCSLHFKNGIKTYDESTPTIFPWSEEWPKVISEYNNREDPNRSVKKLRVIAPQTYGKRKPVYEDGTTPRERRMKKRRLFGREVNKFQFGPGNFLMLSSEHEIEHESSTSYIDIKSKWSLCKYFVA